MLRNPTSRLLLTAERHLLQASKGSVQPRFYSQATLSHWSSLSPPLDNRRRQSHQVSYALPVVQLPLAMQQIRFSSSTSSSGVEKDASLQGETVDKKKHSFSDMFKRYGPLFLSTYLTVYVSTVGGLFVGIESGMLDPAYIVSWISSAEESKSTVEVVSEMLEHYPWTQRWAPAVQSNPQLANFAVAWIATKFTEPIRFGVTVAIVPPLARYLGYDAPAKVEESESKST